MVQGQGSREGVGGTECVLAEIHLWRQLCELGRCHGAGSICGTPLLRAMSAHSVAEALQDCFVEFLVYCLASRYVL